MSESVTTELSATERRRLLWELKYICFGAAILFILVFIVVGPITPGGSSRVSPTIQNAREIGILMTSYYNDHRQRYPDGKSSTEIFQKLLNDGYVTDPTLFYLPLSGKLKAIPGQKLKPENVCWDVTSGVDASSPDDTPIVFVTGYKVRYLPGGEAVPIVKPSARTWLGWWQGEKEPSRRPYPGLAVCYKNNSAMFMDSGSSGGVIPNFISPDFKPDGKTYRQLTPDGVLPEN